MKVRDISEAVANVVLPVAAVMMLGLYVHDRKIRTEQVVAQSAEQHVKDWKDWAKNGIRLGPDTAAIVIATFVDFQCPYCRHLAPVLDSIQTEFKGDVALEIHHFPLTSHELAIPMAIAAECADRQGDFKQMYNTLYAQVDSIGTKRWARIAAEAQIKDIPAFEACVKLPATAFDRIAAGLSLGKRIGIKGTPSMYVNGTYSAVRSVAEFRTLAKQLRRSSAKKRLTAVAETK